MAADDLMLNRGIFRFLDERFGSNRVLRYALSKIYPDHWSFYLGEFALYTFMLLVATGIWLTFVYVPAPAAAYDSVAALDRTAPVGYLVRQVHHWSAVTFVAAMLVHMGRIFFTGAFRKPRELNWIVGVLMLLLASITGFTGYSLPFDDLAGTGLRIADSVMLSVPYAGRWAADVLNGGPYPGPLLLPHLYTIHAYFLPVTIGVLVTLHLGMLIAQKHTQFVRDPEHVVGRRFWPDYALRTIAALAFTCAVVIALASTVEINPITVYGPYHDWIVPNPAVPDWYAAFLDGALRIGPAVEITIAGHPIPPIFWPGVVLPSLTFGVLLAWPWIDAFITRDRASHDVLVRPSAAPWRVGTGSAIIAAGVLLTLAASDDQQAMTFHVPITAVVTFYRIMLPFGSIVVGLIATEITAEIHRRIEQRGGTERERAVALRRDAAGGFVEEEPAST